MTNLFPPVVLNTTIPTFQLLSQLYQFITLQDPLSWVLLVFVFDDTFANGPNPGAKCPNIAENNAFMIDADVNMPYIRYPANKSISTGNDNGFAAIVFNALCIF